MRKAYDLHDIPRAGNIGVQKVGPDERDQSHEAEDANASGVAVEMVDTNLQAIEELPVKNKGVEEKTYPTIKIQKITSVVEKKALHV